MNNIEFDDDDVVICFSKTPICIVKDLQNSDIYISKFAEKYEKLCQFVCWNLVDCDQCNKHTRYGSYFESYSIKQYNELQTRNRYKSIENKYSDIYLDGIHLITMKQFLEIYDTFKSYEKYHEISVRTEKKEVEKIEQDFEKWKETFLKNNKEYQSKLGEKRKKIRILQR